MENASKALTMAGGILLAILLITLLIRSFSNVQEFQMSQLSEEEQKQLVEFNSRYIKLLNEYVYGHEVLTLMNKHENDGLVKVEFEGDSEVPTKDAGSYTYHFAEPQNETRYYKCVGLKYDNSTGKVKEIIFEQIKLSAGVTPP